MNHEPLPAQGPVDVNVRSCTCHPDDNPPSPCAKQYATNECRDYDEELHKAWVDAAMVKAYDFAEAYCNHQCDGENDRLHEMNTARRVLREHLIGQPASMMRESELVARMEEKHGVFMAQATAEVKMLYGAIEAMRVAGGSQEFQAAFDAAKALLPNAEVRGCPHNEQEKER